MAALREVVSTLPPGFRFYPSDEELVCHYLRKKVANERVPGGTLVEVDLHAREPWELPEAAKLTASEWYFFSFRDRKYATGSRANRATRAGYCKATGRDREVRGAGMRKTLVFYRGRAPNGVKAGWVMHEFRLHTTPHSPSPPPEDWVLCRVFQKTKGDGDGDGQYGPRGASSSPAFAAGSSHVATVEAADLAASGYGGGYCSFATQREAAVAVSPPQCYGATAPGHDDGLFPRNDAGGATPGLGFGFGHMDGMGGLDDMAASLGGGGMGLAQGWNWSSSYS